MSLPQERHGKDTNGVWETETNGNLAGSTTRHPLSTSARITHNREQTSQAKENVAEKLVEDELLYAKGSATEKVTGTKKYGSFKKLSKNDLQYETYLISPYRISKNHSK